MTHQGLAFTKHGFLLDGQHRLWAIIECGATLPMRACINEPVENYEVIDCGRNRSNLDVVRMGLKDSTISTTHTLTLKSMLAGRLCKTANRWTNAELTEQYREHIDAVDFAVKQFRNCTDKRINDPTVRGVIARAFYTVPHEQLELFCSQITGGGDHPCRAALDAFVSCLESWSDRRESTKQEIHRRCELTLEAFLMNSADVRFDKSITELFPLPSERR